MMIISNTYNDHNIEFIMDNTILQIINSHKHLDVVLSSKNNWTNHPVILIRKFNQLLNGYPFLENLNINFIKILRPLLEYTSEVWNGCNQIDEDRQTRKNTDKYSNNYNWLIIYGLVRKCVKLSPFS